MNSWKTIRRVSCQSYAGLVRYATGIEDVGDLVADLYVYGVPGRVSREAPVLVLTHERDALIPRGAYLPVWHDTAPDGPRAA